MNKGSCLCGEVQYELLGVPERMSHCHCSICRKIHGTPFATYIQTSGVKWLAGEQSISKYESSAGFERCFCKKCGSVLPESIDGEDFMFVPAGGLDGEIEAEPEKHIFASSKADWYQITDDLPQFDSYSADAPPGIEQQDRGGRCGDKIGGSCQCGKVTFQFNDNAKLMMYCHCTRCRKVKGAAHAANVFVSPDDFEWLQGEDNIKVYDHADAERFGNSFCKSCGSSVPRKAASSPMVNIPAGSLDDAPGVESKGHIYIGSKSNWFEISDGRDQFEEMPPG